MEEDDQRVSQLSEAQRLALLDSERQLTAAIWEHLHARALIAEAKIAAQRHEKSVRWVVLAAFAIMILYKVVESFFPSAALSSTSTVIVAILAAILFNDFLKGRGTIGVLQDKGRYAERLAMLKIDALVPANAALLYEGFSIDEHLTHQTIVENPTYRKLRSTLISQIMLATDPTQ